jgi:hypothetical protein
VPLRRRLPGILAAAAIVPALFWFGPALAARSAPSFRDQGDFFYPLKLYTTDRLRSGEIPLWNPLSGAGEPWLANAQAGVFYPPTFLFLLPQPAIAGILFLLLHFAIGAWGMRRFLAGEAVSESGALFGSAVFVASGFAASLSAFWNHFGAWAWLPVIAAIARSGVKTRGALLALALFAGLQAMAGSPEISGLTALLALALALIPTRDPEKPWLDSPRKSLLRAGGGLLLGLALAGWVIVPMGELALNSDRRGALSVEEREPGTLTLPALAAGFARPPRTASRTYWLSSLFVGPLALAVALAAFFERERRRLALLLAGIGVAGLLVAAAGPPGSWLRAIPPLDRMRYPEKWLAATFFSLAALGGLGLDTLRFQAGGRALKAVFVIAAAAGLALALGFAGMTPLSAAISLGLFAALALALGAGRGETAGGLLAGAASLALLVSLAIAGRPLFTFAPEAAVRSRPPVLDAIGNLTGRVLTPPSGALSRWVVRGWSFDAATLARQREALTGYTNLLFGVSTVRTAAALPTGAGREIADSIDASPDPARAAGPASARVLWSPFQPTRLPSRKVGQFFRAPIAPYRPRLSFARSYRVERDPRRAWSRVASGEVDLAREVLLDRDPSPRPSAGVRSPILLARLAQDRPERVVAEITTNSPGLLVLTDLFYPGWIAEEEGRRLEILRADGFFRAVALPAGTHRVTFRYRPLSVLAGAGISAAALLTILLLASQGEPIRVGRRT